MNIANLNISEIFDYLRDARNIFNHTSKNYQEIDHQDDNAPTLDWQPLQTDGNLTQLRQLQQIVEHQLVVTKNWLPLLRTAFFTVVVAVFPLVGLCVIGIGIFHFPFREDMNWIEPLAAIALGSICIAMGSWILILFLAKINAITQSTTFDKNTLQCTTRAGWLEQLFPKIFTVADKPNFSLQEVYALQILSERVVQQTSESSRVFTSYELNLVLKNGKRFGLFDFANQRRVTAYAGVLQDFLNVPVLIDTHTQLSFH